MRALIVGQDAPACETAIAMVARAGFDRAAIDVASWADAAETAESVRYGLAICLLPPDWEWALKALRGLRNATAATILAVGPADEPKRILHLLREGVDEYLDAADIEAELEGALIRIKTRSDTAHNLGRTYAVLAPCGGCGVSTLAANLAVAFAAKHGRAGLFDLSLPVGDLAFLLDLEPVYTLADVCRNHPHLDRSVVEQAMVGHASGVSVLASPASLREAGAVQREAVRRAVGLGRTLFPHLVVDLGRGILPEQAAALALCDALLLVLRLDMTCLRKARASLDYLAELGVPEDRILAVANFYGMPKGLPLRKFHQALGLDSLHLLPYDPSRANRATNDGSAIVRDRPRARISRAICDLAGSLDRDVTPADNRSRAEASYQGNGHGNTTLTGR